MSKQAKILSLVLGLLIIVLVWIESVTPKPVNWTTSFSKQDKNPFGNYLVFNHLSDIFDNVEVNSQAIFENRKGEEQIIAAFKNWIFIDEKFEIDSLETDLLLQSIAANQTKILIASSSFSTFLEKQLGFETSSNYFQNFNENYHETFEHFNLVNPKLKSNPPYQIKSGLTNNYFSKIDTIQTQVLGENQAGQPNFIAINLGEGKIFLHSNPLLFTNYNFLHRNNSEYIAKIMAYLKDDANSIVWDEHYKTQNLQSRNPLRYILNNKILRWIYYTILVGIFFFVIFGGKRKQRIIPIIEPHQNTTLEFVETIGQLYYQKGNHQNLLQKKIVYFYDFIRQNYYLKVEPESKEFKESLAQKAGKTLEEVNQLFQNILKTQQNANISESELVNLHTAIEKFKKS